MKYINFKYFNGICQLAIVILFTGLLMGCIQQDDSALYERGRNFPEESQLHYSDGIFIAYEVTERIPSKGNGIIKNIRLTLRNPLTKDDTDFYCTYTAYHPSGGSCPKELNLSDYNYQQGRIGWYYQDDFMGYHNPYPQAVTVQVGDKKILTYDYTRTHIDEINKRIKKWNSIFSSIMISINLVLAVLLSLLVFFYYKAIKDKKRRHNSSL